MSRSTTIWVRALLILVVVAPSTAARAADPGAPVNSEPWRRIIDAATEWQRVLADWWQRRPLPIPTNPADQKLVAKVEQPVLQNVNLQVNAALNGAWVQLRVFAAKLKVTNLTLKPVTIEPAQIELKADGTAFQCGVFDPRMNRGGVLIPIDDRTMTLDQLRPQRLQVAPGFSAETWVVFVGLPRGVQVPAMTLRIGGLDPVLETDVNAQSAEALRLRVERTGPRGCLGVLTIGGEFNCVNYQTLLEALTRLGTQKVQRVVVTWNEDAPRVPQAWLNEFLNVVQYVGRSDVQSSNTQLLPSSLIELQLADLPAANRAVFGTFRAGVHATKADATVAALRTVFEVIPREELLESLRSGDVETRCAAAVAGANRLRADEWPLLAELIRGEDLLLRRAALLGLRHFSETAVIEELLRWARSDTPNLSAAALASLADSRYAVVHEALLKLYRESEPPLRQRIVAAFAQSPRPDWSAALFERLQTAPDELGAEGLRSLIRVGHPDLLEALLKCVKSSNGAMQQVAFFELAGRNDSRSEAAALEYTLKHLESAPPTPEILTFLNRVKPPSVVPVLLKHLDQPASDRGQMITLLAQFGDSSVAEAVSERYAKFTPIEQASALSALGYLQSRRFNEHAAVALQSKDFNLISTACSWLQTQATAEGTQLLITALQKKPPVQLLQPIAAALAGIGSPAARLAIRQARAVADHETRPWLTAVVSQLHARSPGNNALVQAKWAVQNNQTKEALSFYAQAIKVDPQLTEAYTGRANLLMRQERFAEASKDYEQAVKLDDLDSEAVTGLAITKVIGGQHREGLKLLEDARGKFPQDDLFFYNAACAYGRAVEAALKDEKFPDRDQALADFRRRALADLRQSLKLGFDQHDWMKKDPDLKSLHDLSEFQQLGPADPAKSEQSPPGT